MVRTDLGPSQRLSGFPLVFGLFLELLFVCNADPSPVLSLFRSLSLRFSLGVWTFSGALARL
jgi:hypothetical protein